MLLPCALVVLLALPQGPIEPKPAAPRNLTSWLVVESGHADAALVLDAVREHYLFPPEAPSPRPEETFLDARGEVHRWAQRENGAAQVAYTGMSSERRQVVMAGLRGAGVLYVNGRPFVGDLERRGDRGVPIELREGQNELFVAEIDGEFELELWEPETPLVIADWAVRHTTLGENPNLWHFCGLRIPVFNATTQPLARVDIHHRGLVPEGGRFPPGLGHPMTDNITFGALPPLCQAELTAQVTVARQVEEANEPVPDGSSAALLEVRCRYEGPAGSNHVEEILRVPYAAPAPHHELGPLTRRSPPGTRASIRHRVEGTTIVYGSSGSAAETELLLAQARWIQQRAWYRWSVTPEVRRDVDYLEAISVPWRRDWARRRPVLLIGNEDSNAAFAELLPVNRRLRAFAGRLHAGGRWWPGDDQLAIHRVTPRQTVIASTGEAGARLGLFFDFDWCAAYDEVLLVRPTVAPGALARFTEVENILPEPVEPKRWLVLAAPAEMGERIDEASCARYILAPEVTTPCAGDPFVDAAGGTHVWVEHDLDSGFERELRCAFTRLDAEFPGIHLARLTGAERLFVNGVPVQGDPGARGDRGFPVQLRKGPNELFVMGVRGSFELELWMSEALFASDGALEIPFDLVPPSSSGTPGGFGEEDLATLARRRARLSRTTLLYGSQGTPEETERLLARARLIRQALWYRWGVAPDLRSDEEVLGYLKQSKDPAAWRRRPLVLIGNCDTNKAWGLWVTKDCSVQARRGELRAGEQCFEGTEYAAFYRLDGNCTVAIDTGAPGQRLALCVDPDPGCAVGEVIVHRCEEGAIRSVSFSVSGDSE